MISNLSSPIIVTGHYGTGKTNLSLNLAIDLKREGENVAVIDLDIVNPYFRTSEFSDIMENHGIETVLPTYASSNLDIPSLTAAVDSKIGADQTVIIDVGGDDAGATALGRYSARIKETEYTMLYVVNRFRHLTKTAEEALELLNEIERVSRLKATYIVNNSNLSYETTQDDVIESARFAKEVAEKSKLPLLFTSVNRKTYDNIKDKDEYYPVEIFVKTPWD